MNERTPFPAVASGVQPRCPDCDVELDRSGGGRYRYWTCRFWGITMPRA